MGMMRVGGEGRGTQIIHRVGQISLKKEDYFENTQRIQRECCQQDR